jgi:transcriptional regulator with XRE-family HTH domain
MTKSESVELAQFLKDKRVVAGHSQKDIAEQLGYSTSQFISNWERGISQPPLHTLRKIALLYKINADEMFNVLLKTTIAQVEVDLKRKFYSNDVSL